jgi:hypothetical protein
MSAVLTMQIMHALFPSLRESSALQHTRVNSDPFVPTIHVQPAEDMELRPLLHAMGRQAPVQHRRSASVSSSGTMRSVKD